MRYLIQESLLNFTQMVVDACHSALSIEEDFVWGKDFLSSPFKYVLNQLTFISNFLL
jgi:dynein heavy chain